MNQELHEKDRVTEADPMSPDNTVLLRRISVMLGVIAAGVLLLATVKAGELLSLFSYEPIAFGGVVVVSLLIGFGVGFAVRS
jgi:hypothetical protein